MNKDLSDIVDSYIGKSRHFDPNKYLSAVAKITGWSEYDISVSRRRWGSLVRSRYIWWATMRHIGGWTYPEISSFVGYSHSLVVQNVNDVPKEILSALQKIVENNE